VKKIYGITMDKQAAFAEVIESSLSGWISQSWQLE
jgi:hypothetical protein